MTTTIKNHSSDQLLRHAEAAAYLGVSPDQLRISRHSGELFKGFATPPYLKMGHAVRYRKSTLDQWLAAIPEFKSTADYQSAK